MDIKEGPILNDTKIQEMLDLGLIFENGDGTYRLSEGSERAIKNMIEANPSLFARIFPDRLN